MKKIFCFILCTYILFDIPCSFIQHFNYYMDGDLYAGVLPDKSYKKAKADSLGISSQVNRLYASIIAK